MNLPARSAASLPDVWVTTTACGDCFLFSAADAAFAAKAGEEFAGGACRHAASQSCADHHPLHSPSALTPLSPVRADPRRP